MALIPDWLKAGHRMSCGDGHYQEMIGSIAAAAPIKLKLPDKWSNISRFFSSKNDQKISMIVGREKKLQPLFSSGSLIGLGLGNLTNPCTKEKEAIAPESSEKSSTALEIKKDAVAKTNGAFNLATAFTFVRLDPDENDTRGQTKRQSSRQKDSSKSLRRRRLLRCKKNDQTLARNDKKRGNRAEINRRIPPDNRRSISYHFLCRRHATQCQMETSGCLSFFYLDRKYQDE